jgi:hypothetical protein
MAAACAISRLSTSRSLFEVWVLIAASAWVPWLRRATKRRARALKSVAGAWGTSTFGGCPAGACEPAGATCAGACTGSAAAGDGVAEPVIGTYASPAEVGPQAASSPASAVPARAATVEREMIMSSGSPVVGWAGNDGAWALPSPPAAVNGHARVWRRACAEGLARPGRAAHVMRC